MSPYVMPGIRYVKLDLNAIIKIVIDYFKISEEQLLKKDRKRQLVLARQLICFFARTYTTETLKSIAARLQLDHTTVMHSMTSIGNFIYTKEETTIKTIGNIKSILKADYKLTDN